MGELLAVLAYEILFQGVLCLAYGTGYAAMFLGSFGRLRMAGFDSMGNRVMRPKRLEGRGGSIWEQDTKGRRRLRAWCVCLVGFGCWLGVGMVILPLGVGN